MDNSHAVEQITARYRSYCDACQSGELEKVPSFWSLPALFAVDTGEAETLHMVVGTPAEMIGLYSKLFGSSTGVDKTIIDSSDVTFYGDRLATIETELRHMAGSKLHDKQKAIYGCRKVGSDWVFISHLSVDAG
jgi:hypothetical protein